ncbi:xylulokinase [Streptacidiphilus sp. MAP12-20]|uniref:xylulokinase n=1 Tax=Streptacidiphilus sp. MAP12-20 TaxID=3156299 RepID=UPI00351300D1
MATRHVVIGIDSSTQSTKALAVDVATGEVLGRGQAPHTVSAGAGRESDPGVWWDALSAAVGATGHAETAEAVSIAGQQHGLVALDKRGEAVRPALLWNDVRSASQAARLVDELGGAKTWAQRTGSVPTAAFTVAKWAWLCENEPEAAARVTSIRLPHDYLTERLTGEPATDRGDASGTGWWGADGYDDEILRHVGLDRAALPPVLAPGAQAGVARADGPLRAGVLVATGTGDNAAAALGLGLRPGQPVLSLGTSGTVYTVARQRPTDPTGTVAGFADALGRWLPLACTLNCTLAVDRFAALLGRDREAVERDGDVVVLPYLDGERTPNLPAAGGLVHGLRHDTTPGQVLQAAYDGAAHALLTALDDVLRAGGETGTSAPQPILLIGGGARGRAWQQTVLRLSGRPVRVPTAPELVALGAAAQAAALLTGEPADEVARRWGTSDGPVLPAVERDDATLDRISRTLRRGHDLLT